MTPQRRTALVSIVAAAALVALKLGAGLASGSLGLISEALHSGTDLVAALLTFFAIGVAGRPADRGHQYGHGKAEHLAALAEATVLALVSLVVAGLAIARLAGAAEQAIDTSWWVFLVVGIVLAIDLSRTVVSYRTAKRYRSEALRSNALHFGSDFAGTLAVFAGLVATKGGVPEGDSIAALFVAALVLTAASRLIRRNVDVLMDRAPADAEEAARAAIAGVEPPVQLKRLRLRQAAGKTFADAVISVPFEAAVGQGHAAADRVEDELERALPGIDVVVHVEPGQAETALRERAHAAALSVPRVREIHNLSVVSVDGHTELSLHLKLPGELALEEAHEIAEQVERAITRAAAEIEAAVARAAGGPPRELRLLRTEKGVVAFLTLGLDPGATLAEAHARASEVEERLRRGWPGRVDGDHVVQLAAQTLQSYFASGSSAREHASYPLEGILLRAPVLEPPAIRVFEDERTYTFSNPAAVRSPGTEIPRPAGRLDAAARVVAVIGADGAIGGWTGLIEWRAPELATPKDRDFALLLGPAVETELADAFDWEAARSHAAANTRLRPGDLLAGPVRELHENIASGGFVVSFPGLGELAAFVG